MYNFADIKETYNKLYIESFSKKDSKKSELFNFYISKLKDSKILREEFECYTSVQNSNFTDPLDSLVFINENVNILKSINTEELKKIHEELMSKLKENKISLIKSSDERLSLFESLLNLEKNSKNINKITESFIKLRGSLVKESSEEQLEGEKVSLPTNVMSNLLANKFNSKYGDLDEGVKNLIRVSLSGGENEKNELFNSTLKECLTLVNCRLDESINDLELKEKLLQTKERLLNMSFNKEEYIQDLSKLIELKTNL